MSLPEFSEHLGIGDRYLRKLFNQHMGMSPKQYALYSQLMFAKQLLHSNNMTISEIGLACGFNSVRRFNDAFQKVLNMSPGDIRKNNKNVSPVKHLSLPFRPPFNWEHLLNFYRLRAIKNIEEVGANYYQKTFLLEKTKGWFKASCTKKHTLEIEFQIDDITMTRHMVSNIRRLFDLDADVDAIEKQLSSTSLAPLMSEMSEGIRIPGVWNTWEAGIRAILGQQISVKAAITQLNTFAHSLGSYDNGRYFFPSPADVVNSDLNFLRMPNSRKETVKRFALYMLHHSDDHPDQWLSLKGIGPWTISYARLRGLSEPDCFLSTDLVIKKAINALDDFEPDSLSPWGSYATFHCWNSQS